ncbi:AraC family transcriptional regulator [Streptomyces sp. NBC_00555]|uniref:AraC family transcriptional regulator n=1 Tax=unclassified Streptomyces TaxID=2593676 RepID=UPI00214A930C|nr:MULTISPECIES: AraC family transcriptional regulator [unclassified Streptomyces]MCX5009755.1 AraC family transcriptional regulator [Streptomyces sp. NBC_00555]UUU38168.1 AraC family transcriptional regulator [Streptomyces sp. NBC_00162]
MSAIDPPSVTACYALAVLSATAEGTGASGSWALPTDRLEFGEMRALWDAVLGAQGAGPHTGLLVGDRMRPEGLHILGHLILTCASLADAALAAERYHPLVSQAGTVNLDRRTGVSRICYRPTVDPAAMHPQQVEAIVSIMVRAARWISGDDWAPLAVSFAHPRTGSAEPYARVLGCPVTFEAAENAITVANEDLDRRRPLYDPALNALHRAYADRLLRQLSAAGTVAGRVRQWLEHAVLEDAGPEGPAKELNLSVRTLRRALHAEGTSWRALLDTARHGRARRLLETTALPLDRIAPLVGLSGATALVRAFTRWEGMPPGAFRSRHRPASPDHGGGGDG